MSMEEEFGGYSLRPRNLDEFIGQEGVKDKLRIAIQAAKRMRRPLEHVLLVGPQGLGKTTLAEIIAHEMGVSFKPTIGPALERLDLSAILTNLQDGDVLFVDEIHRMKPVVQETLYPAMEDYVLDITIGQGPSANVVRIPLPKFTLVGATTREGLLTAPFRGRFGIHLRLDYYLPEELKTIILMNAEKGGIRIEEDAAYEIARRSRGTPRIAKRHLRRVWDYALVKGDGVITLQTVREALEMYGIDELGLEDMDRRILRVMIEKFNGGPVGLNTIATAVSEDARTVEDVYEPYLIKLGFITLTPRGRVVNKAAYEHLGIPRQDGKQEILWR
ncbi:TPA: Holliday junction branch migration DNA helicase RuvB [Candidatus Poribacteria bacterium]|nr:Holliday junction branch migration DNA helicase RuvB [Candidatus Poribacteria bacterium]